MEYQQILRRLYRYSCFTKHHKFFFHNCYPQRWFESDFISVTNSDFWHEYEIKRTEVDFKKDFTKEIKHSWLGGKRSGIISLPDRHDGGKLNMDRSLDKDGKVNISYNYELGEFLGPNYFWYVCPVGVIDHKDIPEYAGLIEVNKDNLWCNIIKDPPRLHKEKLSDERKNQLFVGIMFKYWKKLYKEK